MTKSEFALRPRSSPRRASQPRITPWQLSLEHHALRLRVELHLGEFDPLPHERALALIPNCEVWAIKNIPGVSFEYVVHFRTAGYHIGAFATPTADGGVHIFFNDVHPPAEIRVHLLEEFFHIWLGHPPDVVRLYAQDGRHRTHSLAKEDEAYGCGIAALVPYTGLEEMLASGMHIARIAEHFAVPVPVVEQRISDTRLGAVTLWRSPQLPLLR